MVRHVKEIIENKIQKANGEEDSFCNTKDIIKLIKEEMLNERFRIKEVFLRENIIVDNITLNQYRFKDENSVETFLEVVNDLYKDALLYPLFVYYLLEEKGIYLGVSKEFEDKIKYENEYLLKIDNIVRDYDLSCEIYENLKKDLK